MNLHRRKKDSSSHPEADKAIREADVHYEEVISRADEVEKVAGQVKKLSKRNHFSERIEAIMEGREYRGE